MAGGTVLILEGPVDSLEALRGFRGVDLVVEDVRYELEPPVVLEQAEPIESIQLFAENQWDNLVTSVADAHERATGSGSKLAIIDTGIDHRHPDLHNVDVDTSASIIDGVIGPHDGDVEGHGTHVAGIAGGTGVVGITGVAPDATLVSVRVFDEEGGASFGDILLAIQYAAVIGADGANLSIGTAPIPPDANRFQYRGIMEPVV
ncbi:MAG: S8 family peptidase, partial [Halobacteriota archaeon]